MSSPSPEPEPPVFVIEDDPDHADLIGRALTAVGTTFEVQGTGELAIQRLKERRVTPDLIFLDVNMPGMNGHEVLQVIRSEERMRAVPVVILTTSDARHDMEEAMLSGASQYRTKPSRWADLLTFTRSMVDRYIRPFDSGNGVAYLGASDDLAFRTLEAAMPGTTCLAVRSPEDGFAKQADVVVHVCDHPLDLTPDWRQAAGWIAVCDKPVACLAAGYDEVLDSMSGIAEAIERARARLLTRRVDVFRDNDSVSFAAHAAHDLKGPSRRMGQLASILVEEAQGLPAGTRTLAEMIQSECRRMHDMVTDMLAFAQDAAHSTYIDVSLDVCVDDALIANRDAIESSQAIIRRSQLRSVYGNPSQLTRVFQNLIGNAVQYRAKDRPLIIEIRSRNLADGGMAVVVSDNGVGIPPEMLQRIFRPLVRASTDTQGTGLGLSIVERAIQRIGGEVRVASEVGVGSAFVLRFPARAVAPESH